MNQLKTTGANDLNNHARPNNPQRSRFDLSKITNITLEPGMIVPIDLFEVLPGDDIDISNEMILDTLPMVAPSLTQYKVLVHWYYMKARDCWKGFKTFWTRGRSGDVKLTVPTIDADLKLGTIENFEGHGEMSIWPRGYHSLKGYLTGFPDSRSGIPTEDSTASQMILKQYLPYCGIPEDTGDYRTAYLAVSETGHKHLGAGTDQAKINAMPFVMYQSIVKNNYVNENLLQDNTALFPEEGDDDWILPYNATTVNFIGRGETNNTDWNNGQPSDEDDWKFDYTGVYHNDDTRVRLDLLRYAMFDNDYFTNGLPWLQRGKLEETDGAMIDLDISGIEIGLKENATGIARGSVTSNYQGDTGHYTTKADTGVVLYNQGEGINTVVTGILSTQLGLQNIVNQFETKGNAKSILTTNALREMIAMQVWMERNARVDGSYNRMIYQHWMEDPNSEEHKPLYIGGTADYINFATVVQNSESTNESPLGTTAGFGNAHGGNKAGSFRANDFGYVMGIMIIKPNTTYEQGLEHFWKHENVFDKMVQPEFQGLSPEPIYNDEIYIQNDNSENNGLFCYQERYQYLKQRMNQNKGLFTAAPEKDRLFSAYTQARWLDSKPLFNYQFLCMSPENMRRDMLAYPNYPMFRCQFASKIFVTRKLAYTSVPETFGF